MEAVFVKKKEALKILDIDRLGQVGGAIGSGPSVLDITGADHIEVHISADGKTLWVNNEYRCLLRVCRIKKLYLRDDRKLEK